MIVQFTVINIHFFVQSCVDGVPEPIAFYPLNGEFKTEEINGRQPNGIHGDVDIADGRKGQTNGSYRFTSQAGDSYIEFPNSGGLHVKDSITILFWMYPQNTDGAILKYKTSYPWDIHMRMVSGKLLTHFCHENYEHTPQLITDQPLPLNQWHHVGWSYDHKTGVASLWLNGNQIKKQNMEVGMPLATQDSVILGAKGGERPYFQGRITAMEIYKIALSRKQINAIGKATQSNLKVT